MGIDPARTAALPALPVPAAFVALESATCAALDAVNDAAEWDASTRAAVLAWAAKHRDQMALVESRVLTAEQQAGTWALKGDRDLAGFAGRVSRGGRGAGCAAVEQAATLETMPAVADALAHGPVTATHVAQITRVAAGSPRLAEELATDAGQRRVVELARRFDGSEFGKQLKVMSAELDPAARQRSHDEQRANRFLHISHGAAGTLVRAQLDSIAGYELGKAIGALNPRPAKDDERDAGQRRADALMVMVHRTLADESTTPGAIAPVQAIVTISQETWAALRGPRRGAEAKGDGSTSVATAASPNLDDQRRAGIASVRADEEKLGAGHRDVGRAAGDRPPSRGSTAAVAEAMRGEAPVVDEGGQAWPASEIARALCDCALTRAVVNAEGLPLELGREQRLFRRQHWLALLASGVTECVWPDCTMPLRNTELHHLTWWDRDNGPSNQDNCGPYCRFHHDWIHNHDIAVTRLPDGRYEHRDRRGGLLGVGGRSPGVSETILAGGLIGVGGRPPGVSEATLAGGLIGVGGRPPESRETTVASGPPPVDTFGDGMASGLPIAVLPTAEGRGRSWGSERPAVEQPELWSDPDASSERLRRAG